MSKPLPAIQRYGLAIISVSMALGGALLMERFHVREVEIPLFLFAIAVSAWYGARLRYWRCCYQPPATESNKGLGLFQKLPSQEKAIIEAALSECGGRVYGPFGAVAKLGYPDPPYNRRSGR